MLGDDELSDLRRTVKTDKKGEISLDRVVPGIRYHIVEEPVYQRNPGGGFHEVRPSEYDQKVVLAPEKDD